MYFKSSYVWSVHILRAQAVLCLCAVSSRALLRLASPGLRASVSHAAPDFRIKGAAMAMAALREASRCLASRGSPAAARSMLLAQSRGITYKLFVGGWFLALIAHFLPPVLSPYARVPPTS